MGMGSFPIFIAELQLDPSWAFNNVDVAKIVNIIRNFFMFSFLKFRGDVTVNIQKIKDKNKYARKINLVYIIN